MAGVDDEVSDYEVSDYEVSDTSTGTPPRDTSRGDAAWARQDRVPPSYAPCETPHRPGARTNRLDVPQLDAGLHASWWGNLRGVQIRGVNYEVSDTSIPGHLDSGHLDSGHLDSDASTPTQPCTAFHSSVWGSTRRDEANGLMTRCLTPRKRTHRGQPLDVPVRVVQSVGCRRPKRLCAGHARAVSLGACPGPSRGRMGWRLSRKGRTAARPGPRTRSCPGAASALRFCGASARGALANPPDERTR